MKYDINESFKEFKTRTRSVLLVANHLMIQLKDFSLAKSYYSKGTIA
jgi:hypothetical protein